MSDLPANGFTRVDTWVFDLDNTLYPRHCDLFSQIDIKMTSYVSRLTGLEKPRARALQKDYYRDYGTTLRGLMEVHGVDPHDFLNHVHDIDYSELPENTKLADLLAALPGRKLIYTNGSVSHAANTLTALGINPGTFEAIFDIVASGFEPKPHPLPFQRFLDKYGVNAENAAMFEDLPRNLEPAKNAGMTTVLIKPKAGSGFEAETWEHAETGSGYIDHATDDLDAFLKTILRGYRE